jgi:MFS superfamily sulfate permease-like transporter
MVRPDFSLIEHMWPGALGIALMSFTETIAAGRAFAKSGEPIINGNKELLATGLANAGSAFFGAMPSGGGTSQTSEQIFLLIINSSTMRTKKLKSKKEDERKKDKKKGR